LAAPAAHAQAQAAFVIPSQPIEAALLDFSTQANVSLSLPDRLPNVRSTPVHGQFTATQALALLLRDTGLRFEPVGASGYRIIPAPRAAQAPAPVTSDEIIITAARGQIALGAIPRALTHVDEERLQQLPVRDARDLVSQVSGLQFTDDGPGRSKVFLRGVSDGSLSGGAQSTVGIYLDGVRLTYAAPDPQLRLVDVRRVDVMRGPQGALYGAGSIGGVLSIESNAPDLESFSGALMLGAESTNSGGIGHQSELVLNLPVVTDRLAVRVAAYDEETAGWLDNVTTGQTDTNTTRRRGGRINALWDITPDWVVRGFALSQAIHADDAQYLISTPSGPRRAANIAEVYEDDFSLAGVTLRGDTRLGQVETTTAYVRHEIDSLYEATGSFAVFGVDPLQVRGIEKRDLLDILVHETRLSAPRGASIPWFVGLFYADGRAENRRMLQDGAAIAYGLNRTDEISELALFGEATWPITSQISLSTGARVFRYAVDMEANTTEELLGLSSTTTGRSSFTDFTPDFRLSYRPTPSLQFHIAVSEGYRGGGLNAGEPIGVVLGPAQPLRSYSGDELWTYEIGARVSLLDDTLQISTAFYYNDWRRIQTDSLIVDSLPYTGNVGHGRAIGFETDALYTPLEGLSLRAHLALNESELVRPDPTFPGALDKDLPGVPDYALSASARYERPMRIFATSANAFAELNVAHTSHSAADFTSTAHQDARTEVDANLGLTLGDAEIMLYVRNGLDEAGETFSLANPFAPVPVTTRQRPRTIGGQIRYRF